MRINFLTSILIALSGYAFGASPQSTNSTKVDVLSSLHESQKNISTPSKRIKFFSKKLLDKKYELGPLGEGKTGRYDVDPLYRFDKFDCTTFVETLIALGYSNKSKKFLNTLNNIRYMSEKISFTSRNHFPELDWMPNGIRRKLFKDITLQVGRNNTKTTTVSIDKGQWFAKLQESVISSKFPKKTRTLRLKELKQNSSVFSRQEIKVQYIPFSEMFSKSNDNYIFKKKFANAIPDVTFFNLVLLPKKIISSIGTKLTIWHQGLIVKDKDDRLLIRHAYSGTKKVHEASAVDFLLLQYLKTKFEDNFDDGGISLFQVIDN